MQHRSERVRLETERYRIFGALTLPRDGYRSRMSDYLNAADREFVSLTDVVREEIEGGAISRHEYVAVSRRHIVFAAPVAEEADSGH